MDFAALDVRQKLDLLDLPATPPSPSCSASTPTTTQ